MSSQSQSDETRITADKTISLASITKSVTAAGKDHVLLTAQGAYLKLEGGDIMIHAPGKVEFKATTKELAGPSSVSSDLPVLKKIGQINGCALKLAAATEAGGASVKR